MISLKDYICEALKPGNHAIAEYELENVSSNIKYNDQIDKYLCGLFEDEVSDDVIIFVDDNNKNKFDFMTNKNAISCVKKMIGLNKSKFEVNVTGNVEDLDGTIEVTKKDDNQKIKIYLK